MVQTGSRNKAESALGELLAGNKRYQQASRHCWLSAVNLVGTLQVC